MRGKYARRAQRRQARREADLQDAQKKRQCELSDRYQAARALESELMGELASLVEVANAYQVRLVPAVAAEREAGAALGGARAIEQMLRRFATAAREEIGRAIGKHETRNGGYMRYSQNGDQMNMDMVNAVLEIEGGFDRKPTPVELFADWFGHEVRHLRASHAPVK